MPWNGQPRNDHIDLGGADRVQRAVVDVFKGPHGWVRRGQSLAWNQERNSTPLVAAEIELSLDGLHSWVTRYGLTTETFTAYGSGGARTQTAIAPDKSSLVRQYHDGQLMSVTLLDSKQNQVARADVTYDPYGRVLSITDARTGATAYTYNAADQVATVTSPAPAPGQAPEVTQHLYDTMGREFRTILPDTTIISRDYNHLGQVASESGSQTYPASYDYDAQGRLLQMTTGNGAITSWGYDPVRGFLTGKTYAGSTAGPSYHYTDAGRLQSRVWARTDTHNNPITTTYTYNDAGELEGVSYSDGTTPAVRYTYDRLGRPHLVRRNGMTTLLVCNDAGQLVDEQYTGGALGGCSLTNQYDALLRRTNLVVRESSNPLLASRFPLLSSAFAYDEVSRLAEVTSGNATATYHYLPNSFLVDHIDLGLGGVITLTRGHAYDNLNRLTSVASTPAAPGASSVSFAYEYNLLDQETRATEADGSHWDFGYDTLGQVTSGAKRWTDGTLVAGEQFGYSFDTIGNRTGTTAGGDASGANLRTATYSPNSLN
jgi:YD repeat-containing protein